MRSNDSVIRITAASAQPPGHDGRSPLLRSPTATDARTMPRPSTDDRISEELSRHGLRATRQRVAALRLLRRSRTHPTSAELHARLVREHDNISQKTVYDILDALVQAGLAARVTAVGEPYRYEARSAPHYHAACRVCGRLFDVPASADPQIRGRSSLPEGFDVEKIDVTIRGVCLRCRDEI
jgi:Fe2+ or Zn2+ uptake regulation protein